MASLAALRSSRASLTQCGSRQLFQSSTHSSSPSPLARKSITVFALRRSFSNYLVTPKELADALKKSPPSPISSEPRVIPLCASWFMPNDPQGRTGIQVFLEKRIPKARFFDLDKVIDKRSPYPHMLPSPMQFAEAMSEIGIRREDTVVVYDSKELGIFSAPRVAWTMKIFGHPRVHILNNFRLWVEEGLPTEKGNVYTVECGMYPIPEMEEAKVAGFEEMREVALDYNKEGAEGVQILDARSYGRWTGRDPEPREGLSSGHMPGSISIPFDAVLDPETKAFLPAEKLREIFAEKGVDPAKPIISSCGTGVTACVVETALNIAQYGSPENRKVYDGSWTEWAQRVKPTESLIVKEDVPAKEE
ncbi:Rhodanese-like domain-containing protein [Diplogelasinospora grovesii]|uniref:Rhodanese-like domain-containing protein n=1 Tax=Diplogelasinospora grovesii TaxID=303347 RepID=A0AAN6N0X1_9PEZI|nr:Rhodanese-like domain-containing protein [Diplogelasinospora grovesii]